MTSRRQARLGAANSEGPDVPPRELHSFAPGDWMTPGQLRTLGDDGRPAGWYQAFRTYQARRAAWCEERGLRPHEIYKFIPKPVAVDRPLNGDPYGRE